MEPNPQDNNQTSPVISQVVNSPKTSKYNKKLWLVTGFIILLAGIGGYYLLQNKTVVSNNNYVKSASPTLVPELKPKYIGNYEVILKDNPKTPCDRYAHRCTNDVYLKDKSTGNEIYILTTDNLLRNDSRVPEYRNGYIFLPKRVGNDNYPSNDWTDELWVYTDKNQGKKILSNKGFTYLVNPSASKIAIKYGDSNPLKINVIDKNGNILKQYNQDNFKDIKQFVASLDLVEWENDNILWLLLGGGSLNYQNISSLDTSLDKATTYDLSKLNIGAELEFNAKLKKIAYSTFPVMFDSTTADEFIKSGQKVYLYLYDLNTKSSKLISTSVVKAFKPQWISDTIIEYNDPNSDKRITLQIN